MKHFIVKLLIIPIVCGVLFLSCDEDDSLSPKVSEITPSKAAANQLLTLKGSDLANVLTIVFETGNAKAAFNSNFNTNDVLLFRVPADAIPGEQNIIITNKNGTQYTVPFNVLGFANITDVSNYNFSEGTEITLTGKNLADVSKVVFKKDPATEVEIVSSTATTLTLKFPSTSLTESELIITNDAGDATTTQSFVALDNAKKLFTDTYADGYQDASWGSGGVISTTEFKSGTASVYKDYAKGNWHLIGIGWTGTPNDDYKYLSFWIKGAAADHDLYITTQTSENGFGSYNEYQKVAVPANVWTYYKLPIGPLKLWATGDNWNQIGWRIKGPDNQDERFYLDDVILIK